MRYLSGKSHKMQLKEHFIFTDSESSVLKRFEKYFEDILNYFSIRSKDLREAFIKEVQSKFNKSIDTTLIECLNELQLSYISKKNNKNKSKRMKKLSKKKIIHKVSFKFIF